MSGTTPTNLLAWFQQLKIHRKGGVFAPHKPLLLLSALASVQRGDGRLISYEELHPRLRQLLIEFGPPRKSIHPEYPFWRLQTDQGSFWQVPERDLALRAIGPRPRQGDIPPRILMSVGARGGFTEEVYELLRNDPKLVNRLCATLLQDHFAPSCHESILDAVGMPWIPDRSFATRRSPEFRADLIRLYEHSCAVCGFDGRLESANLALEAAHIQWHAQGGPDTPSNGLLLCSLHHTALDRGAIGITEDRRVMVSQHVYGGPRVTDFLTSFSGDPLRRPLDSSLAPAVRFISWHRKQVFRGAPR